MITVGTIASLAPVGRRVATAGIRGFLRDGASGMGCLTGSPRSSRGLGFVPLIVAGVSAGASIYQADQQAGAAADAAAISAAAMEAPYKFEYKAARRRIEADKLAMAFQAVSGTSTIEVKDRSALYIAGGIGLAVLIGGFLVMRATR